MRRTEVIAYLLRHPDYPKHWANIWTVWLLTRTSPPGIDRDNLHAWLADYQQSHPEDVLEVDEPMSADQELSAVAVNLWAAGRAPLVVASKVGTLGVPVVTNVFASRPRVARVLGTDEGGLHAAFRRGVAERLPV